MTRVLVRRTKAEDIDILIKNIREADRIEVEAATGLPHDEVMRTVFDKSQEVWTGLIDDEVVAVFGVHVISAVTGTGVPWLISTDAIWNHRKTFIRNCKPVFKKLCYNLNSLINYVDDRNELAKDWLKWMGFTLHEPVPYGVSMMPFRCFTMEVNHV